MKLLQKKCVYNYLCTVLLKFPPAKLNGELRHIFFVAISPWPDNSVQATFHQKINWNIVLADCFDCLSQFLWIGVGVVDKCHRQVDGHHFISVPPCLDFKKTLESGVC